MGQRKRTIRSQILHITAGALQTGPAAQQQHKQTMVSSFYSATEILTHCSAAAAANSATRPPARSHKNIISLLAPCSLLVAAGGGRTQKISGQIFLLAGPGPCTISAASVWPGCWLPAAGCWGELLVSKFNLMPDKGLGHGSRGWAGQRSIA